MARRSPDSRRLAARGVWAPERRLLTLGLLGLITAIAFEGMAVPTVLPATVEDLGGLDLYGWAFAAFWLTNIVGITVAGRDADRHGPLRSFLVGVSLFAAGLAISAAAGVMAEVIAGRAVQGLGAGAIGSVVFVVIARSYQASAIPRMLALNSSAWVLPGLIGPAVAAQVVAVVGWRWVFGGLAPLVVILAATVVAPIIALGPPAATDRHRPSATLAALRLAAGAGLVLGGLAWPNLAVAAVLIVGGSAIALPGLRSLLPAGSLTARPGRPAVLAVLGCVAFGFFGTEAFVPLATTAVRGAPLLLGGLALSGASVTWTVGSWIQARLAPRGHRRSLVAWGAILIAGGIGLVAASLLPGAPFLVAPAAWTIAGLGMGLAYSTLTLLVLQTATPGEEGASSAALQLMFTLGTAVGSGVGGAIVALADRGALPLAAALALTDAVMLVAVALSALLSRRLPVRGLASAGREAEHSLPVASPGGSLGAADTEG